MIVNRKLKYVYIGIPRTASKSMMEWLVEHYKGESIGHHHQWQVPKEFEDYLRFTVVRNPYERVISGEFFVPWGGMERREEAREMRDPPKKPDEPLDKRLSEAPSWGDGSIKLDGTDVPEVAMNQWSFVKRAGISLVLFYERLPHCLGQLPFVHDDLPEFPHVLERGIRPQGTFFDWKDDEEEQILWAYASDDFKRFGYERYDFGLPNNTPDSLWIR